MKKIIIGLVLIVTCWGFTQVEPDSFPTKLINRMLSLVKWQPQEKVYLHTDRDHYEVGDKVWFRAYLANAINHKPSDLSRYVYVELVDRQDSVYNRVKVGMQDSVYAGYMPLGKNLTQGDYFLRAYTFWMQNTGDKYILRKKIRVINPQDSKVQTEVKYEKTPAGYVANIRFFNSREEPYNKVFINYKLGKKSNVGRTDEEGYLKVKIDTLNLVKKMHVEFQEENPFPFNRYVYLPDPQKDFHVTFLPEGGDLLAGCQQLVAFKAEGMDGLSREVSGWVYNERGEEVVPVRSLHKGMGAVELLVQPGESYYAVLSTPDSVSKRFDLPQAKRKGVALKVLQGKNMLGYVVLAADSTLIPDDLYIVMHCRGVPLICEPLAANGKGKVVLDGFPEGIVEVLLMGGDGEVYSRRLTFVRQTNRPEVSIQTDKSQYTIREGVHMDIQINADTIYDHEGYFSVAVTDKSRSEIDSTGGNILSDLLLTSDLTGYIEEPGFYFKDNRISTRSYLNLLMLTNGWSRFKVEDIYNQKYDSVKYYLERGQAISGKVKNFWGKDAGNANLVMLSTTGLVRMVEADTAGRFLIDGIAFPDSTKFVIQGRSKKGRRSVEVLIDEDRFLRPSREIPMGVEEMAKEDEFYKKFQKDFYYDNGIKVYVLDEAIVRRKKEKKFYSFYDNMADYGLDSAKLAAMGNKDMHQVLMELPGVETYDDSIKRFGKTLYVLVNDWEEDLQRVWMMQPKELVNISLLLPPTSGVMFGEKGNNGVLIITTNPNYVPKDMPRPNMATFTVLGYQKKAEFYMPHYEIDSVRMALADTIDHRVTVYWNPAVKTDKQGKASCFFTTSDSGGPYKVIIEGILNDGTVCRKEGEIKLK